MSIDTFSNFIKTPQTPTTQSQQVNNTQQPIASAPIETEKKSSAAEIIKKAAPIVVPLASIPVAVILANKTATKTASKLAKDAADEVKNILSETISKNQEEITKLLQETAEAGKKNSNDIWKVIAGIGAGLGLGTIAKDVADNNEDVSNIAQKFENATSLQRTNTEAALATASVAANSSPNVLGSKYVKDFYGIPLLNTDDSLSKNNVKYKEAIEQIQTAAVDRLHYAPKIKPIEKENPTIWSVTSEFAPIKEGGLGSVPVEVQANAVKLGVDMPAIIPMYQQKGVATLTEENGKFKYIYKGKEFDLEKAVSFKVDAFQAGKSNAEEVEVFIHNSKDDQGRNKQLVFIKNDNYFNGTIYQTNEKTEEPEKFAFFSKAVYELMKVKEDIATGKDVKIANREAFDGLNAPDALMLNDWQASPVAALARYKAPMENAYGQINDKIADKIRNMNIITIGHNAQYQGSTAVNNNTQQKNQATSNILNTLFDNYTYDIVTNAKTAASKTNLLDDGLVNLDNALVLNANNSAWNHTNLLNMGIILSDYFHPVSKNYAQELISSGHEELAGELQWALTQKAKNGALFGVINGNDFNRLSIEAKKGDIKKSTGLDYEVYKDANGKWNLDSILKARKANKVNFYNNYMIPFTLKNTDNDSEEVKKVRELSSKLEFVDPTGTTKLEELTPEELAETPIISMVGRFVTQKGIDIMADAIDKLYKNWDKDFPGQKKPIFYIAGGDAEGGKQRAFIEDLKKNKLSAEDNNRVIFAHGFAPMQAITAASDFFLMPSRFEPCGLTQGESFALATPVIASAVGGIVDTVNRDGKVNGVLTDQNKKLDSDGFYNAIKDGLNIYFNDKDKYNNMLVDAYSEDFSWILPGKQGPVYDYLDKIGMDISKLPDVKDIK